VSCIIKDVSRFPLEMNTFDFLLCFPMVSRRNSESGSACTELRIGVRQLLLRRVRRSDRIFVCCLLLIFCLSLRCVIFVFHFWFALFANIVCVIVLFFFIVLYFVVFFADYCAHDNVHECALCALNVH
jgi:hypothetical protein